MVIVSKPHSIPSPSTTPSSTTSSSTVPRSAKLNKSADDKVSISSAGSSPGGKDLNKSKRTKSRNGCLTCKKKRLKCDETKPSCLNCQKRNLDCGGYATSFKWRSFNDDHSGKSSFKMVNTDSNESSNSDFAVNRMKKRSFDDVSRKPVKKDDFLKKHLELASLSVVGKTSYDIKVESDLISRGLNPNNLRKAEVYDNTFIDGNVVKKMKRSLSQSNDSENHPHPLHRSMSMNSHSPQFDFSLLKQEYSKIKRNNDDRETSNGLDSLANAAIGEIKTRSPSISHEPYSGRAPKANEYQLTQKSKSDHKRPSISLSGHPTPAHISDDHPFNLADASTLHDLNLTPNLTALINYAFTGPNEDNTKDGDIIDMPLSPLALTTTPGGPHNNQVGIYEDHHKQHSPFHSSGRGYSDEPPSEASGNRIAFLHEADSSAASPMTSMNSITAYSPTIEFNRSTTSLMKTSEQEQILHLYCTYTSSIMSIKNGPNENPWRNRIAPFATTYPCLFNSIASMTLFHLAGNTDIVENSINLRSRGCVYMKKCILELATGLSKMNDEGTYIENGESSSLAQNQLPADIALTTCLNLAVSESWDTHTSSGIAHLKGAKSMIQKVLKLFNDYAKVVANKPNKDMTKEEYLEQVRDDRRDLRKKLVLVDESDWDKMTEDIITNEGQSKYQSSDTYLGGIKLQLEKSATNELYVPKNLQFLFNIWIYFEVLAQMTTCTNHDDKGIDLVATITTILQSTQKKLVKEKNDKALRKLSSGEANEATNTSPSIQSDSSELTYSGFGYNNNNGGAFSFFDNFDAINFNGDYIDPLLGCAQSLFLIMGKVANLICKINKTRRKEEKASAANDGKPHHFRNSLLTITQATELRQRLNDWRPTFSSTMLDQSSVDSCRNSGWDMPSCIATAESYRYATLLYLHQAVPEIPSLSSHQLAEKIFILMASIPTNSDLAVVHIFPLLVASCEAEAGEEREWCESRWLVLSQKMWLGNIDRALEVVKEVWRRKDEFMRKKRRDNDDAKFNLIRSDSQSSPGTLATPSGAEHSVSPTTDISAQISGLMAAIGNDPVVLTDINGGISSRLHWSSVMREWDWEVMLG